MDKQHILAEIKRTADANDGVALGRQRFFAETGIRESDWLGRFWARWSEAVVEAGYAPNKLQERLSDADVLMKYAQLVRELGRVPVAADLKLHARNDSEFPSHNVFGRFGGKQELLRRVMEFASQNPGFESVAAACSIHPATTDPTETQRPPPTKATCGTVYLIKVGRYYKIGRTSSLSRRERELAIQMPEQLETVHSIQTDDPPGIEAYWHGRFAEKRMNGEWFDLRAEDVAVFRRRKFM